MIRATLNREAKHALAGPPGNLKKNSASLISYRILACLPARNGGQEYKTRVPSAYVRKKEINFFFHICTGGSVPESRILLL